MKISISLILTMLLVSCSSVPRMHQKHSATELVDSYSEMESINLEDVLTAAELTDRSLLEEKTYFLNPSSAKLIDFGTYKSPAILIKYDNKDKNELVISSFVVKSNENPMYLFYPIITVLDQEGKKISEVLPKYEFSFYGNILENIFIMPEGAQFILIHTSPKFTGMTFNESRAGHGGKVNPNGMGIAQALGGATGAAIYGVVASGDSLSDPNSFVFSVGGAVSITSK